MFADLTKTTKNNARAGEIATLLGENLSLLTHKSFKFRIQIESGNFADRAFWLLDVSCVNGSNCRQATKIY